MAGIIVLWMKGLCKLLVLIVLNSVVDYITFNTMQTTSEIER